MNVWVSKYFVVLTSTLGGLSGFEVNRSIKLLGSSLLIFCDTPVAPPEVVVQCKFIKCDCVLVSESWSCIDGRLVFSAALAGSWASWCLVFAGGVVLLCSMLSGVACGGCWVLVLVATVDANGNGSLISSPLSDSSNKRREHNHHDCLHAQSIVWAALQQCI